MSIHKIAAKLTVLCAILDERETAESDLAESRLPTALRLARETSALASAEQTRLEKASAAWALALTRTAMLTEAMPPADPHWVELCVTLDLTPAQWETYRPLLHVEDGVRVTVEPVAHVERTGAEVSAQPAAPLRPAEEIAREMVPTPYSMGTEQLRTHVDCDGRRATVLLDRADDADALRGIIARLIEQRDAEHAAAERERQAAQPRVAQFYTTPDLAAMAWAKYTGRLAPQQPRFCSCGKPRPRVDGTLCQCLDCGGFCDIAEPEPIEQPRDLAGRIRALLAEIMPEPHVTGPVDGPRYWTSVVPRADSKGLRMGLDWEREASEARRKEAIEYLAGRIETIVRGEVKP